MSQVVRVPRKLRVCASVVVGLGKNLGEYGVVYFELVKTNGRRRGVPGERLVRMKLEFGLSLSWWLNGELRG